MSKRILITGCTGTIGGHLIPILRAHLSSSRIVGTARRLPSAARRALLDEYHAADLGSRAEVEALLQQVRPDAVMHLAAQRGGELLELFRANVLATDYLLTAMREQGAHGNDTPVVVVGSASEIGACESRHLPLDEDAPCRPVDAHGVTKSAQSLAAQAAFLRHGQCVIRARVFNLLGPALPATLLPGRCVQLLDEIARGDRTRHLEFADLSARRDYTDVRDVCHALLLTLQNGKPGRLYHIGSGQALSGRELVEAVLEAAIPDTGPVTFTAKETPRGGIAVPIQIADARRAARELGWRPEIPLARSIEEMWRATRQDAN